MKEVAFLGSSLADLRSFPDSVRQRAGYQLRRIQGGKEPTDWKPMRNIGKGVLEIRIREEGDAFRVIYIAKFEEAVYVLHAFQKKSQKTSKRDLEIIKTRFKQFEKARNGNG